MPFPSADRRVARALAKEAETFAQLLRKIPVDNDAPRHPEIQEALNGFKRINRNLAARNKKGEVTLARKVRIGREFQQIGSALRKRRAAR